MQTRDEVGKYVTDGVHVYPYNAFLDEKINAGTLQFCERPVRDPNGAATPKPLFRSPLTIPAEESMALAQRMGITLGDLRNMSPQEFEAEMQKLDKADETKVTDAFPT